MNQKPVHMCPRCYVACDCDYGRQVLEINKSIELTELKSEECEHDCDTENETNQ